MAPTLDEALDRLFDGGPPEDGGPAAATAIRDLAEQALQIYARAQERLRAGDLPAYSREIERLGPILQRLRDATRPR
jgi:uncharacterized membrane protein (UPF0182 family)